VRASAAIARGPAQPFSVEPVELRAPGEGEVLVRIAGVGICHTDLRARDLKLPVPQPVVLGHEGAGVVEMVGPGVGGLEPGDHVVLTFRSCGACSACHRGTPALCADFAPLNFCGAGAATIAGDGAEVHGSFFGQSAFATHALAHEGNAVRVRDDVPIELMGPLGCSVQTGAGTVLNVLRPEPGTGLAVFGTGGVGLSAILAAHLSGVSPIVAVDVQASRLELAMELGATAAIDPRASDAAASILELTGGVGVGSAIDTTGLPGVVATALAALAKRGTVAAVAAGEPGAVAPVDLRHLLDGRTLTGVIEGMSVPGELIPALADLHAAGRLPFDRFVRTYPLAEINRAVEEMESGAVVKPVLLPAVDS
jgi:aryl-alcohol dehydrogenase